MLKCFILAIQIYQSSFHFTLLLFHEQKRNSAKVNNHGYSDQGQWENTPFF